VQLPAADQRIPPQGALQLAFVEGFHRHLVGTRGNPGRSSGYVQKALKRLNFTEVSIKKLEKNVTSEMMII
jgi:hypothetical protein